MNNLQKNIIYDKVYNFIEEDGKFNLLSFVKFLNDFSNNEELLKNYIVGYFDYLIVNYNFDIAKQNFSLLKEKFPTKTIIEFLTKLELKYIFDYADEKIFQDREIKKYVLNLIDKLEDNDKKYWLAIKEKLIENNYDNFFNMIKNLAFTGFEPAVITYKSLLRNKITEDNIKEIEKEVRKFALSLKDYNYLGDFYFDIGDLSKAIESYELGIGEGNIDSFFNVIDSYYILYEEGDVNADRMLNYYIGLLSDFGKLSDFDKLRLSAVKGDFAFKVTNDKNTAFEFYYSAFEKAVELKEQDYIENLGITIFNYFFDFLSYDDMFSVVKEVQISNPNSDISFKFYEVSKDYVNFLALSLELSLYNIPEKLYYFIDKQIEEAIKKLSYKDLFSIVDIKSIEKEYPGIFLTEEVLRGILDGSSEFIDKEKLSNKQNDLIDKTDFLLDLVVKVVEEESSDGAIKFEDDEEKILKELGLDLSPNFLEDIEKLNKEILDKLETINDLITLLELKERVNGHYESEKEVNIYDIFSLFTLLEPKTKDPKILGDYFNKLNSLYLSQVPYINIGVYIFLRNIYINSITENTEKEKEFKGKIEYAFWYLETKGKVLKENKVVPEFILNTFKKILKYEALNEKDLGVVELILSSDLEGSDLGYSINDNFITGETKFVNLGNNIISINDKKESLILGDTEGLYSKKV